MSPEQRIEELKTRYVYVDSYDNALMLRVALDAYLSEVDRKNYALRIRQRKYDLDIGLVKRD